MVDENNKNPLVEDDDGTENADDFETQEKPQISAPQIQSAIHTIRNSAQRLASNTANNIKTATKTGVKKGLGKIAAAAAPFLAKAALAVATGVAIILAVLALIARILITILLWTIGFILFVVFVLFIINSGAYMVPPGENLSSTPTIGDSQCTENERPECPCGWPVLPAEGEGVLDVYQGSHTIQGGTHNVIEAIDIIHLPEGYLAPGHPVTSRVTGTVRRVWSDPQVYGNAVEIESVCQGNSIVLRYGHNTAVVVAQGEEVAQNQVIAYSGDSGMGGPHVHYEFANPTSFAMQPVYIPKQVPEACNSWSGNPYPCNVQIP